MRAFSLNKSMQFFRIGAIIVIFLSVFSTFGFAQDKTHEMLRMVTGTPTGTWFPTGAAVAELANKHYKGEPVSVTPGAGSIGNIMAVGSGKSDLGISYGSFLKLAQKGDNEINPGEPLPQLRAIMSFVPTILHMTKTPEAGFEDLDDLKGLKAKKPKLRIGTGVKGSTEDFGLAKIFSYYGITFDDVKKWGGSITRGITKTRSDAWQNRQIDITTWMWTPPNPQLSHLFKTRPGKLLSLPQDLLDYMVKEFGFGTYTIEANSYPGQTKDVQTVGLPMVLFTTEKVDAEIVYLMAKSVAENPKRIHQVGKHYERLWTPDIMYRNLGIEMHEGAARYYKEVGWIK